MFFFHKPCGNTNHEVFSVEGEKRDFGSNGTSIAGKAFVERESKEVGILQIPTSMVPHTYLCIRLLSSDGDEGG